MPLFHQHDWQLADKTILPSAIQQMDAAGIADQVTTIPAHAFEVTVVLSWRCAKCGALKTITESSP